MAASVPAGARIAVLGDRVIPLPIAEAEVGLQWSWCVGPATRAPSDETYAAAAFAPGGAGLRPFSVVHVEQPWRRGRVPGDLTIRWTRRDRALVALDLDAPDVPMSEEREAYEVDILDGSAVLRTLTATDPSVVYPAAQQIADRGALLAPGDSLDIRIAQLSARIGRGTARTITLTF